MTLSPEEIQKLLAMPQTRARTKKAGVNLASVESRDFQTWFKLQHRLQDYATGEGMKCDNPNCNDPRVDRTSDTPVMQSIAMVCGQRMCRFCFLDGWLVQLDEQTKLT